MQAPRGATVPLPQWPANRQVGSDQPLRRSYPCGQAARQRLSDPEPSPEGASPPLSAGLPAPRGASGAAATRRPRLKPGA